MGNTDKATTICKVSYKNRTHCEQITIYLQLMTDLFL